MSMAYYSDVVSQVSMQASPFIRRAFSQFLSDALPSVRTVKQPTHY